MIEIRNRYNVKHMDLSDVKRLIAYNINTNNQTQLIIKRNLLWTFLSSFPLFLTILHILALLAPNKINSLAYNRNHIDGFIQKR